MWIALSMIALFAGYCWLDSISVPFLQGTAWSNAPDDDTEWRTDLADFLDELGGTKIKDYQSWQ